MPRRTWQADERGLAHDLTSGRAACGHPGPWPHPAQPDSPHCAECARLRLGHHPLPIWPVAVTLLILAAACALIVWGRL